MRPGHEAPDDLLARRDRLLVVGPSMRPGHEAPDDGARCVRAPKRVAKGIRECCDSHRHMQRTRMREVATEIINLLILKEQVDCERSPGEPHAAQRSHRIGSSGRRAATPVKK